MLSMVDEQYVAELTEAPADAADAVCEQMSVTVAKRRFPFGMVAGIAAAVCLCIGGAALYLHRPVREIVPQTGASSDAEYAQTIPPGDWENGRLPFEVDFVPVTDLGEDAATCRSGILPFPVGGTQTAAITFALDAQGQAVGAEIDSSAGWLRIYGEGRHGEFAECVPVWTFPERGASFYAVQRRDGMCEGCLVSEDLFTILYVDGFDDEALYRLLQALTQVTPRSLWEMQPEPPAEQTPAFSLTSDELEAMYTNAGFLDVASAIWEWQMFNRISCDLTEAYIGTPLRLNFIDAWGNIMPDDTAALYPVIAQGSACAYVLVSRLDDGYHFGSGTFFANTLTAAMPEGEFAVLSDGSGLYLLTEDGGRLLIPDPEHESMDVSEIRLGDNPGLYVTTADILMTYRIPLPQAGTERGSTGDRPTDTTPDWENATIYGVIEPVPVEDLGTASDRIPEGVLPFPIDGQRIAEITFAFDGRYAVGASVKAGRFRVNLYQDESFDALFGDGVPVWRFENGFAFYADHHDGGAVHGYLCGSDMLYDVGADGCTDEALYELLQALAAQHLTPQTLWDAQAEGE